MRQIFVNCLKKIPEIGYISVRKMHNRQFIYKEEFIRKMPFSKSILEIRHFGTKVASAGLERRALKLQAIRELSPKMKQIYDMILKLAPTDARVLIQGEEGTEKELVAQAIHFNSLRRDNPFISVNCSAYPQTLLESELFGHEEGAFEGAIHRKIGCFEKANRGTVFLDRIEDIPPISQMKLLRLLQSKEFERLGGEETIRVDIRLIAATNKDLRKEVEKGTFREDLFYQLNIISIHLPPLRQRKEDIPLLVEYFLEELNSHGGKRIKYLSPETMQLLVKYNWPRNVKELENVIQHAFLLAEDEVINKDLLPSRILNEILVKKKEEEEISTFEENEKRFLMKILQECNWNKLRVAKRLNISRSTLYAKLKKYNLMAKPVRTSKK